MPLIKKFEDMFSWQKARELNKIIYLETQNEMFNKDFALKVQIRKSSISIMSNIAEGFERSNDKEFRYFLKVAKGSAGELRSQLYIASDLGYINQEMFNSCYKVINDIARLISKFIAKLNMRIAENNNLATSTT